MATVASPAGKAEGRRDAWTEGVRRVALLPVVLLVLWGIWEGYRALWIATGWTWPFAVNDITMPHMHGIVAQLFRRWPEGGPLLVSTLWHASLFTAREAVVGFAIGATVGFFLAVLLVHSKLFERGILPYIVASQTIPLLAIAPMVVVGLGSRGVTGWVSVSVTAAYLTFFPVAINSLRGLKSADPRAFELMRSYAASRRAILWKLRVPASLPYLFAALKVSATASVVGAIISELPSGIQEGLGGAIYNFQQYYTAEPRNLWATNIVAALLGITFFLAVVVAEKLVVRRAPEHFA